MNSKSPKARIKKAEKSPNLHEVKDKATKLRTVPALPSLLCFEKCSISEIPNNKRLTKLLIEALKAFSNPDILKNRGWHPLNNGPEQWKKHAGEEKLYSLDVGQRNSKYGDTRLICYIDKSNPDVAKVLVTCTRKTH